MIGSLFMFTKSILVLIFFSVLCCVALVKEKIDLKRTVITITSFCISEVALFFAVYLIYPKDIQEMKNAAEYQTTLLSGGSNVPLLTIVGNFINNYVQSCVAIPFLILGLVSSIYLFIAYAREKNIFKLSALIMAWVLPIDMIVISNCYFIYHYFTLVLPCIVSLYLYLAYKGDISPYIYYSSAIIAILGVVVCWRLKEGTIQVSFINYSTVLIVLLHLIVIAFLVYSKMNNKRVIAIFELLALAVGVFFYGNYSSFVSPKSRNLIAMTKSSEKMMENFPDDFGEEPVLLLDSGTVTFYRDAKSYSEYYYNLPMQRWSEGKKWAVQESEYNKLMKYSGKYIVYMDWFRLEKYPELQNKIENEYIRLDGSGYWAYSATWNMFQLDEAPDAENVRNSEDTYILIRKDRI